MGRRLEPLRLSAGFWVRADVREALAARDFGGLFRLVSRWAGASQTQIAIAVAMTQGQISGIMAGKRQVIAIDVAERVLDGLDAPDAARLAVGLAARSAPAVGVREHAGRPGAFARAGGPPPVILGEDVGRRDVLRLGGALAIGTAIAPSTRLSSVMLAPNAAGDVEPMPIADLARRVESAWQLRQRADYDALGHLVPTLIGQAETSVLAIEDAEREQAARLVVHTYNAASSLLRRLGDESLALLAADRAVRAARSVGDPLLVAAAMYRLANVLLSAGRAEDTKVVALQAADLTDPGTTQTPRNLSMWGSLLLTAAVAAARHGQEPEAWELLGEARAGSRMLAGDHADIFSIFGPTNVAIHAVQVAVELRNGADGVRRSRDVDPDRLPASLAERRGQYLIDVAHGHVLEGNDGEAVVTLQRAESVAPQEVRLSDQVHGVTRIMLGRERVAATRGLRELAERIGVTE